MTTEQQTPGNSNENPDKLYAGKFKTVEELEAGYKNSLPTFQENETLKAKVKELSTTPESYLNPSDIEVDPNRVTDIQARAKEASMTQAQYEKFLRSDKQRLEKNKENFEKAKKEVGEETLNMLQDYVTKHYPKPIQDNILNTFIGNSEARKAALEHRQALLNSVTPGMNKTAAAGGYTVTDKDIKEAYDAKEKGDLRARDHYLNLLKARAEQRS